MVDKPGRKTEAVVLSGGGANGAYEVGVLKALLGGKSPATGSSPLSARIFTGTSIGSYNAAFMVSHWDAYGSTAGGNLETVWLDRLAHTSGRGDNGAYRFRLDPFDLLNPSHYLPNPLEPLSHLVRDSASLTWEAIQRTVQFATEQEASLRQRLAELFNFSSFVSTAPWDQTVRETIDFENIRISTRTLRIAATNWTTGELTIFSNPDMTNKLGPLAILASSAVPGVFPAVLVGAEPHVDGGVLMNTPLKLATDAGADCLHVIYLDPDIKTIPFNTLQSTVGTVYRQQTIAWAQVVNDDIADAAVINEALEILGRIEREEAISDPETTVLAKSLNKVWTRVKRHIRYRSLTIHRYRPRDDLSGGSLGLLNFHRSHIEELIQRGFDDAVRHNCQVSGCVLPKTEISGDLEATSLVLSGA